MDKDIELLHKIFKAKKRNKSFQISDEDFEQLEDYLRLLSELDLCQITTSLTSNANEDDEIFDNEKFFYWKIYCCQNGNVIINDIDKIFNGPLPVTFYLRKR